MIDIKEKDMDSDIRGLAIKIPNKSFLYKYHSIILVNGLSSTRSNTDEKAIRREAIASFEVFSGFCDSIILILIFTVSNHFGG